ncbi:hypothetical protein BV349_05372 [Pseudomonas syringae pv. actinidiae]|nr:hypothetical protein BV349_05372 [Pseudomonas syringae pv. actinidiae]OSN67823.1 hypothetical protein BV351_05412 [Pseudomonas syringae pv. actinidiae]RMS18964.1 hypothetical protein ALP75_202545 [Pseudomonas syringae pv. actinidiae]
MMWLGSTENTFVGSVSVPSLNLPQETGDPCYFEQEAHYVSSKD